MAHTIPGGRPAIAPLFITQQRKLSDFLADQNRIATIKADWLYQMGSRETRLRLLRDHGFTPALETASGAPIALEA